MTPLSATSTCYSITTDVSLGQEARRSGAFDLVLEGAGYSPLVFDAMQSLAKNGAPS